MTEFEILFEAKAVKMNNNMRIPLIFAAEITKYYPHIFNEAAKKMGMQLFMPYESLKGAIQEIVRGEADWLTEGQLPIVEGHVPIKDKDDKTLPIKDNIILGFARQLIADDNSRKGKGTAWLRKNKLGDYITDYLEKGNVIGVSIGGWFDKLGPAGKFMDKEYDGTQEGVHLHHIALVTNGLPRCPTNVCGFNLKDQSDFESSMLDNMKILEQNNTEIKPADKLAIAIKHYEKSKKYERNIYDEKISPQDVREEIKQIVDRFKELREIPPETSFDDVFSAYVKSDLFDVNIKEFTLNDDNYKKIELDDLTKEETDKLLKKIADLESKNKKFQEKTITDEQNKLDAMKDMLAKQKTENEALEKKFAAKTKDLEDFEKAQIDVISKVLLDGGIKQERIDGKDLSELKDLYETVKDLFTDAEKPDDKFAYFPPGYFADEKYSTLPKLDQKKIADKDPAKKRVHYYVPTEKEIHDDEAWAARMKKLGLDQIEIDEEGAL